MDWNSFKMTADQAERLVDEWDAMTDGWQDLVRRWARFDISDADYDPSFAEIRDGVVSVFRDALVETGNTSYDLDLKVGLKLYELLSPGIGFDIVTAADDDVWRYISMRVFPDLTFLRYPNHNADVETIREEMPEYRHRGITPEDGGGHIRRKRFYKHTRRIWLKTLWWYIYLSWQGSQEETFGVLQKCGTDAISQLIERIGRGYRPKLYREMMLAYSHLPKQSNYIFKAATKLNLANCFSLEPALTKDGESGYSERLFKEVNKGEAKQEDAENDDFE